MTTASPASSASTGQPQDITLQRLRQLVSEDLERVDAMVTELVKSHVRLIPDISLHTLLSGGKRLRPILTLATAAMCGYQGSAHIALATSVEFIHTATLLHDDVVDKSSLRRGKSTANDVWGNKESILVGDFLLGRAFSLMGEAQSLNVYRILSSAAMVISEGEVMQLEIEGNLAIDRAAYIGVVAAKAAELFAAACEVGGVIAQKDTKSTDALRAYGYNLGIAFQIVDDALDYSARDALFGKHVGDDFKDAKITLPVLLAYEQADGKQKAFWDRTIGMRQQEHTDFNMAVQLISQHRGVERSMVVAQDYLDKAGSALSLFQDSPIKDALLGVLMFVKERGY